MTSTSTSSFGQVLAVAYLVLVAGATSAEEACTKESKSSTCMSKDGDENVALQLRESKISFPTYKSSESNPMGLIEHAAADSKALKLTIVSASGLLDEDWVGDSDPFVVASIVNKPYLFRTPTEADNANPVWNFGDVFDDWRPGDKVSLKVIDEDDTTNDDLGYAEFIPDCASTGTLDLALNTSGSVKVMVGCIEQSASKLLSMVKIASYVYDLSPAAGPWDLVKQHDKNNDKIAIYQSGKECVMAFSGTDDLSDVGTDLNAASTQLCGYDFHAGFSNEFQDIMSWDIWKNDFEPYLASDECRGGVTAVGHSLGGSVATIFAACFNADPCFESGCPFYVKELYTIGAPTVAKQSVANAQSSSGCFDGARIFNEDPKSFDPVPYVANLMGFVHPQVKAIEFIEDSDLSLSYTEYDCTSDEAKNGLTGGFAIASLHSSHVYVARAEKMFKTG